MSVETFLYEIYYFSLCTNTNKWTTILIYTFFPFLWGIATFSFLWIFALIHSKYPNPFLTIHSVQTPTKKEYLVLFCNINNDCVNKMLSIFLCIRTLYKLYVSYFIWFSLSLLAFIRDSSCLDKVTDFSFHSFSRTFIDSNSLVAKDNSLSIRLFCKE